MKQIYYVIQTLIHGKGSIPFKVKPTNKVTTPASAIISISTKYGPCLSWKVKAPNRKP